MCRDLLSLNMILMCTMLFASNGFSQDDLDDETIKADHWRALVVQLGAPEFEARESATEQLKHREAILYIAEGIASTEPEIAMRSIGLLVDFLDSQDKETVAQANRMLDQLESSQNSRVQSRVSLAKKQRIEKAKKTLYDVGVGFEETASGAVEVTVGRQTQTGRPFQVVQSTWTGGAEELALLQKIPNIVSINFLMSSFNEGRPITKEEMKAISEIDSVRVLNLPPDIDDEMLSYLADLTELQRISFTNSFRCDGNGFRYLRNLTQLKRIEMFTTGIRGENLRYLVELPNLESVTLPQTTMNDEGVSWLTKCPNLKNLHFDNTCVTDDGFRQLSQLQKLEALYISDSLLSDEGLHALGELSNLKSLTLSGTFVSEAAIEAWKQKHPNVRVRGTFIDPWSSEQIEIAKRITQAGGRVTHSRVQSDGEERKRVTVGVYVKTWRGDFELLRQISMLPEISMLHVYGIELPDELVQELELFENVNRVHITNGQ